MSGNKLRYRIKYEGICQKLEVSFVKNKMIKNQLWWFGQVQLRLVSTPIKTNDKIIVHGVGRLEVGLNEYRWKQLKRIWK